MSDVTYVWMSHVRVTWDVCELCQFKKNGLKKWKGISCIFLFYNNVRAKEFYFHTCFDRSYFHTETKVSQKGSLIQWPYPQILVVFGSFVRVDPRCCPQQSCSTMDLNKAPVRCTSVTKNLEDKVQQQDEDAKSSQTGCRSLSRAHHRVDRQIHSMAPWMVCDSCAASSYCYLGGLFCSSKEGYRESSRLPQEEQICVCGFMN